MGERIREYQAGEGAYQKFCTIVSQKGRIWGVPHSGCAPAAHFSAWLSGHWQDGNYGADCAGAWHCAGELFHDAPHKAVCAGAALYHAQKLQRV